jgi:pyruvyltransferase
MKNCVLICCDNKYVPLSIIALNLFTEYNNNYDKVIIGTQFSSEMKELTKLYNIRIIEVNLNNDFININKRPRGKKYPIECFYHFYSYKVLDNYNYIVVIHPDIYTNKSLDVDFNFISYIGASYYSKEDLISSNKNITNDFSKIKSAFSNPILNQTRISGGFFIYNVQNLKKINFYEKIVHYYKKSWNINAPRCGDYSLLLLYQMLNKEHIYLLEPEYNVTNYNNDFTEKYIDRIILFHFTGSTKNYWEINYKEQNLNDIVRYFYDNMVEYIYNGYSQEFIKKYLPTIYIDISNIKIPFYYYNEKNINNFGDLITPYFLRKYCDKKDYSFCFNNRLPKIISCGSIMRMCNENVIVYGSGIRDINQNIKKGIIKIVRGPLTRNRLLKINCYCPPTYGDPGLLLPLYYNPKIQKKYKLGIIPHHIHYNQIKKMYSNDNSILIINLINNNIEIVIKEILKCQKIISSSLHGLIVSDAYNIPNKWIKFNNEIKGDDTKFYDYFSSVNRKDIEYINCYGYKKIPHNVLSLIENVNISFDLIKLKKKMFFDENGIKNYTKYLYKQIN